MNWMMDGLIAWGAISVPLGVVVGRRLRRNRVALFEPLVPVLAPEDTRDSLPLSSGLSRTEQHAFDAAHNPNYRGGYKVN